MAKNICVAASLGQLVAWHQFATSCGYKDVSKLCLNFIKWNFFMVASGTDWPNLELDTLILLLSFNDLVVKDETVVFRKVEEWLEEQEKKMMREIRSEMEDSDKKTDSKLTSKDLEEHMWKLVKSTLTCVRFPMMSPGQIADLLLSPIINKYMPEFLKQMSSAVAFQRQRPDAINTILTSFSNGDRLITPRLYTEDNYCDSLSVDNFKQLPSYHCR